jgi:tetratricopeptide (TPR) repeat protein
MPVFLLLLLLLVPQPLLAKPGLLSFAESLAAEGDHYRAITEFKRFLHYRPKDPRAAQAQLAIANSLRAGKRWGKLDLALEKVWLNYPDSPQALQARKLYADAAFAQKSYAEARQRYQTLKKQLPAAEKQTAYRIGLSYLQEDQPDAAEQSFAQLPATDRQQLQHYLSDYRQLPRKSPPLSATLSAILPGAGQLYTEHPKQAAMAFALNAAFIYGAVEAWNHENYAVSAILSLFEIGWYGGNVYNAMNNAHKYNRQQRDQLIKRLQEQFSLSLNLRKHTPLLQANFRF